MILFLKQSQRHRDSHTENKQQHHRIHTHNFSPFLHKAKNSLSDTTMFGFRRSLPNFEDLIEYDTSDGRTMMRLASSSSNVKVKDVLKEKRLPSPITFSKAFRFCIRTSFGSFKDYTSRSLLHAGVSNSRGVVYNFDERGHHRDDRWIECVSAPLDGIEDFDEKLNAYDELHRKRVRHYSHRIHREEDEMEHPGNNCFDYVVGFLNYSRYKGRNDHTVQSIERDLLTRPMMDAAAYINHWRALKRAKGHPLVVSSAKLVRHPHPLKRVEGDPRAWSCDGCEAVFSGDVRFRCMNGCDFDLCVGYLSQILLSFTHSHTYTHSDVDGNPRRVVKV